MTDRKISRALLSVSDKTGLIDFAKGLARHGVALISTGGTAKALRDAGLQVQDVSDITNFPEMMDGRVKTLHPNVHGGLLALRDKPDHAAAMKSHGIEGIDLLVCNLYPFEATVQRGADFETTIENIDIGGPAMTRSAALAAASGRRRRRMFERSASLRPFEPSRSATDSASARSPLIRIAARWETKKRVLRSS